MAYKINKPKKLTCKQIKYFEKDESKAKKEYNKLGLHSLAKDEAKHHRYFEKLDKKRCKK